jgi:hypothetical protein
VNCEKSFGLERAMELAARAHAGQVDKSGDIYLLHLMRVTLAVRPEARRIATLHDVVEDTEWTLERLAEEGLPPDEVEAIGLLTRREGESYDRFIDRVRSAGGRAGHLAREVKVADVTDNLGRMPAGAEWDRLRTRYRAALETLGRQVGHRTLAEREPRPSSVDVPQDFSEHHP